MQQQTQEWLKYKNKENRRKFRSHRKVDKVDPNQQLKEIEQRLQKAEVKRIDTYNELELQIKLNHERDKLLEEDRRFKLD